jgi:hypothetical protein
MREREREMKEYTARRVQRRENEIEKNSCDKAAVNKSTAKAREREREMQTRFMLR